MRGIRAREVRNYVRAKGEQGMVDVLEQALERVSAVEQQNKQIAAELLAMANVIEKMATGALNMREQIEKLRGLKSGNDDDDLPMAT